MKKVRMPFQVLSLEGELLVEEDSDLVKMAKEAIWSVHQRQKANKRACWRRHKDEYNASRKSRASSIRGKFLSSRRKAENMGQKWLLTQEEWQDLWIAAGSMSVPGTVLPSAPLGTVKTAYAMRGGSRYHSTYMTREDLNKPWQFDNCYIGFRGRPLIGGNYHITQSDSAGC